MPKLSEDRAVLTGGVASYLVCNMQRGVGSTTPIKIVYESGEMHVYLFVRGKCSIGVVIEKQL